MAVNRSKALSIYQTEANRFNDEEEIQKETSTGTIATLQDDTNKEKPQYEEIIAELSSLASETTQEQRSNGVSLEELQEQAAPRKPLSSPLRCEHVNDAYESVMLFQLRRMIRMNTKPFAVMLKILIQGDPKRKI